MVYSVLYLAGMCLGSRFMLSADAGCGTVRVISAGLQVGLTLPEFTIASFIRKLWPWYSWPTLWEWILNSGQGAFSSSFPKETGGCLPRALGHEGSVLASTSS